MSCLSADDVASLKSNLASKKSALAQWQYAGAYFKSFGASKSGVLEVAYHAIKAGQSFSFEKTKANACDAIFCLDTAERVYHGTSLAAANLNIKDGFIRCAFMEDSFVMFSSAVFLPSVFVLVIL